MIKKIIKIGQTQENNFNILGNKYFPVKVKLKALSQGKGWDRKNLIYNI